MLTTIPKKAAGCDRGVVPVSYELAPGLLTKPVRATPDGRLDLLDVIENVTTTRHGAVQALDSALKRNGVDVSTISRVRWKRARGPHDAMVAYPNTAMVLLLQVKATFNNCNSQIAQRICNNLEAKKVAQEQAEAAERRAQSAEASHKEAEQTIHKLEGDAQSLVARIREMEQHSVSLAAAGGSDLLVQEAQDRLQQLQEAEVAAEDAMCLTQLRLLYKRVKVPWQTRQQMAAMYLGWYAELHEYLARAPHASCATIRTWLCNHPDGQRCWFAIQERCGWPPGPYDASLYEVEHVLNAAWGGADHALNFMILPRAINNSIEFRCGPGHLKMILLGRPLFELVQRFARWDKEQPLRVPRSRFLDQERGFRTESLLGMRQTTIGFEKRQRTAAN